MRYFVCLLARVYQISHETQFKILIGEVYELLQELRSFSKHSNFFRFSHVVLCVLALQSMLRLMGEVYLSESFLQIRGVLTYMLYTMFSCFTLVSFLILFTMVMMILILLLCCYDELHRCTRRISNDVRTLRMGQTMTSGERLVLVEQLRSIMEQLNTVRTKLFMVTTRLIKFFRFYLLLGILYCLVLAMTELIEMHPNWKTLHIMKSSIALFNLAFYVSVFEIFMWKSKLSRSFWSLHLLNYHRKFDRTMDKLLYCELVEHIQVKAYGIRLDTKLFWKILNLSYTYILMRFVYQKF
ncbi:uncharacterized protein CG32395 [Teleopsis dalmanni]|uniref:uncharacterized protein CG32395 n=1 Tax=Teleopsis dalmanni TaxID=139649 RepID=UPI0018CE9255|nr:uncharacterized protein CG32395 [Teleopsis dalmanni]